MTPDQFKDSLRGEQPPANLTPHLLALWYEARGDWHRAHGLVQDLPDVQASWIHAYLHRREGDIGNADYWYQRAGRKRPATTLEAEWQTIAGTLLAEAK